MADEEIVAAPSPEPSDHKRKFEDLESELEGTDLPTVDPNENLNRNSIAELVKEEEDANGGDSEAKRPRLDDKPDDLATENGYQDEDKLDETNEEIIEQKPEENNTEAEDAQEQAEDVPETTEDEAAAAVDDDNLQPSDENVPETVKDEETAAVDDDNLQPSDENPQLENEVEEPSKEEFKEPEKQIQEVSEDEVLQQADASYVEKEQEQEQQPESEPQTTSRKIEVPNAKVGVLIGKGGDTIRFLQLNSGARIQITRDVDADPNAPTRPVQLLGTLENINNAERLIKEVIAEADAGGSPALVARGFNNMQSSGAAEQIEIQVPNAKVGLIIGKGGETIKNLQTRSGARIQLIPQRSSDGEQLRERTVRLTGDKKQIETAGEMIKEVMSQQVRPSSYSRGYNQPQQQHGSGGGGPHGPPSSQWGPQGPRPSHSSSGGYDYPQRGPSYPSHTPPPSYNNYPPQQMDPRTNFNGYQRPNPTMQGPPPPGGYNYYNQGGPTPPPNPVYNHTPTPTPAPNYNYGQQGQDYGQQQQQQPPPYSQTAPVQNPYGGYGPPHAQSYAPQGPPVNQAYGQNVPAQQPYPYASSAPAQQTYPSYGSAPTPVPAPAPAPGPGYQGGQPGYGQQAAPVYAQTGPTGGYGQYPATQPGYAEQPAQNNVGYGYQAPADQAYGAPAGQGYGAPASQGYGAPSGGQPAPVQPGYDQSVPQSGGY